MQHMKTPGLVALVKHELTGSKGFPDRIPRQSGQFLGGEALQQAHFFQGPNDFHAFPS